MFMRMTDLNTWCANRKFANHPFFLTGAVGATPPITLSLQVRTTTDFSYLNMTHRTTGCYTHLGNHKKAQELLDACPALMEKKKLGAANYLPTEVLILRKCKSPLPNLHPYSENTWDALWYSGIL